MKSGADSTQMTDGSNKNATLAGSMQQYTDQIACWCQTLKLNICFMLNAQVMYNRCTHHYMQNNTEALPMNDLRQMFVLGLAGHF